MARGILTEKIKDIAYEFLGRNIDTTELRLYPYLDYTIKNSQKIEPYKINPREREILSLLKAADHIEGGATGLSMTRDFYNFLQDILFEAYVNI